MSQPYNCNIFQDELLRIQQSTTTDRHFCSRCMGPIKNHPIRVQCHSTPLSCESSTGTSLSESSASSTSGYKVKYVNIILMNDDNIKTSYTCFSIPELDIDTTFHEALQKMHNKFGGLQFNDKSIFESTEEKKIYTNYAAILRQALIGKYNGGSNIAKFIRFKVDPFVLPSRPGMTYMMQKNCIWF